MIRQLTATSEHAGVRLDAFLSADGQLSRSQAARLIEEGRVAVDGRPAAKSCRVAEGQQVTVDIPEVKDTAVEAQDIPLDDTLCLALLPYFLAAQLLSGENEDLAAWFLQRYREALQDLKGKLPGEFEPISTPYGLF